MQTSFEEAVEIQRGKFVLPDAVQELFERWPKQDYGRICVIAAHHLRHVGSPAREWQPWLALASWGSMLQEDDMLARALALLARVYPDIAKGLSASVSTPRRVEYHALTYVLGLLPATERPALPSAERMALIEEGFDSLGQGDCYGLLADAISRSDWELFQTSFDQLAEFALEGRAAGSWNAEFNPGYEPIPAALVAVARNAGFPLERLSDQAKAWVWPVIESEAGIVPASWPFANSA